MPGTIVPQPIPSEGVQTADVAVAATVQLTKVGQATKQGMGQTGGVRTVSAATYIASTDTIVEGDTTSAGFTLTLPTVAEYSRMYVYVERLKGANTLTIAARGTDTIDGAATVTVTTLTMFFPVDNATWHAVTIGN